ncbi:hypothetical protein OESDEN_04201 [Oesophagostomum dentatum]|uniref:Uncharacterized protein n=1 Tax=Oesophagostomum dentatum TaxID=61180 RepID=A0A0B1TE56_OESDE|nr:hypothetical protein OESDEN_04201 [Oesophagostomum dentatum]
MEGEIGPVAHYFEDWHPVKRLGNELLKASNKYSCAPIGWWIENIKSHCWNAIAVVTYEDITSPYNCCPHDQLLGPRPETQRRYLVKSDAYQNFRKILLMRTFQRDLTKASPTVERLYARQRTLWTGCIAGKRYFSKNGEGPYLHLPTIREDGFYAPEHAPSR